MTNLIAYSGEFCSGACRGELDNGVLGWLIATFGIFLFLMILLALLVLGFWVWMLVDAIKRDEASFRKIGQGDKSIWIIILILSLIFQVTLVGALVYFFLIYQKDKPAPRIKK